MRAGSSMQRVSRVTWILAAVCLGLLATAVFMLAISFPLARAHALERAAAGRTLLAEAVTARLGEIAATLKAGPARDPAAVVAALDDLNRTERNRLVSTGVSVAVYASNSRVARTEQGRLEADAWVIGNPDTRKVLARPSDLEKAGGREVRYIPEASTYVVVAYDEAAVVASAGGATRAVLVFCLLMLAACTPIVAVELAPCEDVGESTAK